MSFHINPGLKTAWSLASFSLLSSPLSAQAAPTFADDIAPIIHSNCIDCHRPEGIGPFSLIDYADVSRRARQISEVVEERYMPPWKPDPHRSPALQGDRSLKQISIDLINRWADVGAPAGDLNRIPAIELPSDNWTLGPPDLVIDFPEIFELTAEGNDVFQNFALRIPVTERKFVRALQFLPEASLVIHHALIAFDPTDATRQRDDATPGPGFASMDLGNAINPNGHIIGWTPGQVPYEVYPGTAFELNPGTDLVVQLHLLPSGKTEKVSPRIGLYFSDEPPTRSGFVLLLRANTIDIPAGETAYPIHEEVTLPVDVAVLSLYPHSHYLGRDMQIYADLPDGSREWLMHIPDWDFNWQSDYRFVEPLSLPAGTKIVMAYTFDNSTNNPRNPSNPPVRVRGGWSSLDEMGEVAIQLLLENRSDLPRLEEAQARYQIGSGDSSSDALYNLGLALDRQTKYAEAILTYESVLIIDPTNAAALNNLGAIHQRQGSVGDAISLFQRALEADPALTAIGRNLSRLLIDAGRAPEAISILAEELQRQPSDMLLRLALAEAQHSAQDLSAAQATLQAGLRWHGDGPRLRLQLGQLALMLGDSKGGTEHLEAAQHLPLITEGSIDQAATNHIHAEAAFTLAALAQQARDHSGLTLRLQQTLTANPHHRDALLMSAGLALIDNQPEVAVPHLIALLRLPPGQHLTENEFLRSMPFPDGVHALAQALVATGERPAAMELLTRRAAEARTRGKSEWGAAMDALKANL